MSAPKFHKVCQTPGFATVIANTATTMERPIKDPATKLPDAQKASRNRELFTIQSHRDPCWPRS